MPSKLNDPTKLMTIIDVDRHPAFIRLWGPEGFERLDEESLKRFTERPGLQLAVFADSPTTFKESIDMAVIAPEIARAFAPHLAGKGFTDPAVGRAIAARFGLTRLPAVGFFRGGDFLGALQGLQDWDAYLKGLAEIGARPSGVARTIAVKAA